MKKVIAKIDFILGDKPYIVGDEIETDNIKTIKMLNEKGFIEPLDFKEMVILERELTKKKNEL